MLQKIYRAWRSFRALPEIVQLAAVLLVAILATLLWPARAHAETRIARSGADEVRVFDGPCVSAETLMRLPPVRRGEFRKAQGTFSGELFFGCWIAVGESVYIQWDDGDQGMVPLDELKPVPEA